MIDYDELNPGIRETVRWLTDLGFETTDSGDGVTNRAAGMDCAWDEPMVAMSLSQHDIIEEANRLWRFVKDIPGAVVQS